MSALLAAVLATSVALAVPASAVALPVLAADGPAIPLPLAGWGSWCPSPPVEKHGTTPTPDPSPQGGGGSRCPLSSKLTLVRDGGTEGLAVGPPGKRVTFSDLPGWSHDDQQAAFDGFRTSCAALLAGTPPTRPALPPPPGLTAVCTAAFRLASPDATQAQAFLEAHFEPRRVASDGFFTGYYEPVVDGSLTATSTFRAPLYPAPADLVALTPGQPPPGLDPALTTARRLLDGRYAALPDRAGIEAGALSMTPLAYVRDPVEAFFIQIQGSARIRMTDGSLRRLAYAGRNGYPYTSIGKVLAQRTRTPPDQMGLAHLKAWIRANGQGPDEAGTRLMQENRSYIFFRFDDSLPATAGPIGGEGVSIAALRSLAIDRTRWPYGLPFWVDVDLPWASAKTTPLRRLMIGQDTGAAIIGPARADIFFGTGAEAALRAGTTRAHGALYVLWPKASHNEGATP